MVLLISDNFLAGWLLRLVVNGLVTAHIIFNPSVVSQNLWSNMFSIAFHIKSSYTVPWELWALSRKWEVHLENNRSKSRWSLSAWPQIMHLVIRTCMYMLDFFWHCFKHNSRSCPLWVFCCCPKNKPILILRRSPPYGQQDLLIFHLTDQIKNSVKGFGGFSMQTGCVTTMRAIKMEFIKW